MLRKPYQRNKYLDGTPRKIFGTREELNQNKPKNKKTNNYAIMHYLPETK